MAQSSEIKLNKRFDQNIEVTGTIKIGVREQTSAGDYVSNKLTLIPPYHTGGPFNIRTRDDASNAFISIAYGSNEVASIKHDGTIKIGSNTVIHSGNISSYALTSVPSEYLTATEGNAAYAPKSTYDIYGTGKGWLMSDYDGSANKLRMYYHDDDKTMRFYSYHSNTVGDAHIALHHNGQFYTFGGDNVNNWNTAYGWGNHASAGYLTSYTDTLATVTARGASTTGNITVNGKITLPQNPVGTTYGNGVSTIPSYMIEQSAGDNDGIRLYAEAGATNDVRFIFEVVDDIETGDTWVFRNKRTYGSYVANEVVKISGAGDITASGTLSASGYNNSNWDTAYGWGDHSTAGYQAASTAITTSNIGSQSVNYANSAGTANSVAWSNVSSKPAGWLNNTVLIESKNPSDTAFPSGFYQWSTGSQTPTGTWFNYINVRHSNTGNGHGYQLGMSYYDNNLWFRSYQGGTSPTFQSWETAIGSGSSNQTKIGYFQSNDNLRAPIFYDSNDTTYYVNPNSDSLFKQLRCDTASAGWSSMLGAYDVSRTHNDSARHGLVVNAGYYPHIDLNATATSETNPTHGAVISMTGKLGSGYRRWGMGISQYNPNELSFGYADNQTNPHYGVGINWGTPAKMWIDTGGHLYSTGSMRSPIFYDSNNTSYYCDPASTSNFSALTLQGQPQNNPQHNRFFNATTYTWSSPTMYYRYTKVANLSNSTSRGTFKYYCKKDANYPGAVHGVVNIATYASASMSVQHDQLGGDGQMTPEVYIDNNRDIWIRMSGSAWSSHVTWHWIYNSGVTIYDGSTQSNTDPGNGLYRIQPGESFRFTWGNTSGPTHYQSTNVVQNLSVRNAAYSPVYYDADSTAYYLNPSDSTWSSWNAGGGRFRNIEISPSSFGDTIQNENAGGNLWLQYSHNGPVGLGYGGGKTTAYNGFEVSSGLSRFSGGIRIPDTNGTINSLWGIYGWDTQLQFTKRNLSTDGYEGVAFYAEYNGLYVQSDYSFRAPIFYDSNNTGYYVNPNGITNLGGANDFPLRVTKSSGYNSGCVFFQNNAGDNSWGIVGEFRVGGGPGTDRPSILFSHGFNSNTWSVGFGSTDDNFRIKIDHGHRNSGWGTDRMVMDRSGNVTFSGDVVAYSDQRVKENVKTISNALEITNKLRGVTYNRTDLEDKSEKIGVIAQEVEKILPQVVNKQNDGTLGVAYGNIVGVLIEAVKELSNKVEELENKLNGTEL